MAPPDDVRATLNSYVQSRPYAALAVATIDKGTVQTYLLSGTQAPKVDERTRFQIGSVTKTFTATALAQMVLEHRVALNDSIAKYLPAGVHAPSYRRKAVTVLSLAEQNSGFPRLPPNLVLDNLRNPYAAYTPEMLYDAVSHLKLSRAPGAQYEYSNFGVTLLGQLLANAAHTPYAQLIAAQIFAPLGMNDSVVTGTPDSRKQLIQGYAPDGSPQVPWDFGTLGAAGSIESDLHDMILYLRANMNAPEGPLGNAMALAQQPRFAYAYNGVVQIGLIWDTNIATHISWHNGETGGYHAYIAFDRQAQQGVVVLANVADPQIDSIGLHALVSAFPGPSETPAQSPEPSPYAGVYPFSPYFAITIFKKDGTLYEQATGQDALELTPTSDQTYAVQGVDAQITFKVDAKGNVAGLTLHQSGVDQFAPKQKPI